jgi:ElaB/YqjD/DUF883 family membrane-anchored ribosome-binding protein
MEGVRGVKYVFLSLRRQLRCQAEGKNEILFRAVEEMLKQTEEDADKEILELKTKYEKLLRTERDSNVRLRGEAGVLKKKYSSAVKERKPVDKTYLDIQRLGGPGELFKVGRIFELGRQARPGRQTRIRLYRPVPAEGQNKFWGHRLTAKALTYQRRHLNNK